MDWKECNINRMIKEIHIDNHLIISLINSSSNKRRSAEQLKLDKTTAASIISLCYESLRELLEALAVSRGFKIYNHECYSAFLKEILKEEELSVSFDRLRKIRNQLNYYGKEISVDEALSIKNEMVNLIMRVEKIIKKTK